MKLKILDANNTEKGSRELPQVFSEPVRPDVIKRAVESLQSRARQRYGSDLMAGKKSSAKVSRRRRDYRGSYGHGISRVPRKVMSRNGVRFNWVGAFAPGTVGGRRAHHPKASKIWERKINIKERRKAIRSAIAATAAKELVTGRGHIPPDRYPFIINSEFESLSKTKQVLEALKKLGFGKELERASERTYKAGKARLRGRKYRKRKGPLFVVAKDCPLLKAASNISGVDAVSVESLNAELLAPGAVPGRLTLFTESAIERLEKEKLFYDVPATAAPKKAEKKEATKEAKKEDKKESNKEIPARAPKAAKAANN
ncbi:50S ribosomal protein L4 [Candidatus Woesearchaeota archaeon]|nr:50S ribosomal protein L4 [Candidatus Woesearchaeota archaeon]